MILVADSGSTKCDWVIFDNSGQTILRISTSGMNPRLLNSGQMRQIVYGNRELNALKEEIEKVFFYGAGCANGKSCTNLRKVLADFFSNARITIEGDLTAAVLGATSRPGVVCVLGTGSNCCYYDGESIHVKQPSLGYMVMDECSGNYFGKKLLQAYFYKKMPHELFDRFGKQYDLSFEVIMKNLYGNRNPSSYLAGFSRFLIDNRSVPFMERIIKRGIGELFDDLISWYQKELVHHPLHFVGSIGYFLQEEIILEGARRGYMMGSFVKSPMDGIVADRTDLIEKVKTIYNQNEKP
ncbi:N-acetylglucosamine kinase [Flagellimonas olearia]|uniref:N-acetylglucosamine kinase n=1 Tax=Flagellimonas olearia TaxID=552546 RepID=A0A6I1E0Y5_9FLAO|nr:N-acetylglucosamine kinase [Allomuricauda olearia]KAB7530262.1 N-acetylglucosamine kinase [Allomuricauda olearia]